MTAESPTLARVIKDAIEARIGELHVSLPAKVLSYDVAKQTCSVEPVIKRKYVTGEVVSLPVINNVPVCMPRAGNAFLSLPIKVGNYVLLIFSERSLDVWLKQGGSVDPLESRKHHLSDAIAIPGVYPSTNSNTRAHADHVRLENGDASFELQSSGKFKISKVGGDELLDLLSQLCDALSVATTNTTFGPQPLINAATYATLKGKIDGLKG
jgi:hypothetical protein